MFTRIGLLLLLAVAAQAEEKRQVVVRLSAGGDVSGLTLQLATAEASMILSQAAIEARWKGPRRGGERPVACTEEIEMVVVSRSSPRDHPGALGYAMPFAKSEQVTIFYDRVTGQSRSAELLGHVMAHEIGHVLIGTLEHSADGVMRERWVRTEVAGMTSHPLHFSADSLDMIGRRFERERQCKRALEYSIALSHAE